MIELSEMGMKIKKILSFTLLFFVLANVFSADATREMAKIHRKMKRIDKKRLLSKVQEIDDASVKFYFTKKIQLVKIIEKKIVDGATVFKHFYFDKKTGGLISANMSGTVFYYYDSDYFAVLSSDSYTEQQAEDKADELKDLAYYYIEKIE